MTGWTLTKDVVCCFCPVEKRALAAAAAAAAATAAAEVRLSLTERGLCVPSGETTVWFIIWRESSASGWRTRGERKGVVVVGGVALLTS